MFVRVLTDILKMDINGIFDIYLFESAMNAATRLQALL